MPALVNAQTLNPDSLLSTTDSTALLMKDTTTSKPVTDTAVVKTPQAPVHLYRVNGWVGGAICVVASAADIYAIPTVIKSKRKITDEEMAGLNKNTFSGFDRWALEQDPSKRQSYLNTADYSLPVIICLPALLAFDKRISKDWARILLMYYEMHCITFSIYNYSPFGPAFQNKLRPIVYYDQFPSAQRTVGNNRNSMYSGHAATAIASTFFMVKVYSDYHPEIGRKKYLLYAAATLPGIAMAYLRIAGLEHFPSDGVIGLVIGAACGIMVPEIHRFKNHKVQFGMSSTNTGGTGINMVWNMD